VKTATPPRNLRSSFSVAHHAREWHYITGA